MDERLMLKVSEQTEKMHKMIIYKCVNGHLRQALEGRDIKCNRCGRKLEPQFPGQEDDTVWKLKRQ